VKLPSRLTILDCAVCLDGGTTAFHTTDEGGVEHRVLFTQHMSPEKDQATGTLPGRLYFDEQLVPMRTEYEDRLLSLLRTAEAPDDLARALVARAVGFVESDDYLLFAERVEQAADDTLYDVWVVWDAGTFNMAVVKTKQLLGVSMKEARELVEQEEAVVRGVKASEVVEWAGRYREAGLGVKVSPEFRWELPPPAVAGG
jgi:ribosomal protein L7/L12